MAILAGQLMHALRILRHPVDGFWELRYEKRAGLLSAIILLILAYVVSIITELATSYIFHPVENKFINPFLKLTEVGIPFATWIIANYMVASINKGQGRLVDVFIGSTYALTPYIVFSVPVALLSQVLTAGEGAIFYFLKTVIYLWTLFLFFVFVQEVHNYDIGETAWIIVLTLFFMLAMWVLIMIFAGLSVQLTDFIRQIYEEVRYRV
jgi:hypothetical protein